MLTEPGRVVLSRAGRDKGKMFVVLGQADEQHLLIADGELRKTDRPKKKKIKHLALKPQSLDIQAIGMKPGADLDAQLRKYLLTLKQDTSKEE